MSRMTTPLAIVLSAIAAAILCEILERLERRSSEDEPLPHISVVEHV